MKIYVFTDRQNTANKRTDRQTLHINLLHFITCISIDVVTLMYKNALTDRKGSRQICRQLSLDTRPDFAFDGPTK